MDVCVSVLLCVFVALTSGSVSAEGNYYDALDLEPTASHAQIKKAFRSLALKFHPDKNKSAEAERRFREIAEAYKVLSSSQERALYDRLGHEAFVKNSSGVPEGEEPDFEMDSDFMWTFADDDVYEYHTFHSPGFLFVFSDGDNKYEEDSYF